MKSGLKLVLPLLFVLLIVQAASIPAIPTRRDVVGWLKTGDRFSYNVTVKFYEEDGSWSTSYWVENYTVKDIKKNGTLTLELVRENLMYDRIDRIVFETRSGLWGYPFLLLDSAKRGELLEWWTCASGIYGLEYSYINATVLNVAVRGAAASIMIVELALNGTLFGMPTGSKNISEWDVKIVFGVNSTLAVDTGSHSGLAYNATLRLRIYGVYARDVEQGVRSVAAIRDSDSVAVLTDTNVPLGEPGRNGSLWVVPLIFLAVAMVSFVVYRLSRKRL